MVCLHLFVWVCKYEYSNGRQCVKDGIFCQMQPDGRIINYAICVYHFSVILEGMLDDGELHPAVAFCIGCCRMHTADVLPTFPSGRCDRRFESFVKQSN
jgi:hypothetical protein